ncbi:MAG: hypothetical protein ABL949_12730 [Fimbriimonadaceae bacterium]
MRRPTSIPPGRAGLVVLAIAFAPLVLGAAKPLVRAAGRGLRKLGESVENMAGMSKSQTVETAAEVEATELDVEVKPEVEPEVKKMKPRAKKAKKGQN